MGRLADLVGAATLMSNPEELGKAFAMGRHDRSSSGKFKVSMDIVKPKADPNFVEKPVGKYVKPKRFKKKSKRR